MSYATIARVQSLISTVSLSGESVPSLVQSQQMIDDTSAEIDAVLAGAGLSVPVTAPVWYLTRLALLNAYGAAAMILKSGFSGPGENNAYQFWESRYRDGLKALISPTASISISGSSAGILPSGYFTRNPDEEEIFDGALEGASIFSLGKVF